MKIENYKPIGKGFLVGKFDIVIEVWGMLTIKDCTLFEKNGERWISLPSKEFLTKENQKKHFSLVKFSPEVFERLQRAALDLLAKETVQIPPASHDNYTEQQFPF